MHPVNQRSLTASFKAGTVISSHDQVRLKAECKHPFKPSFWAVCWILFAYRTQNHRTRPSWRRVCGATRRVLHACVWHRWTWDMLCKRMNRRATWRWLCCLSLPIWTRCWRWLCYLSLPIVTRGAEYVVSFFPLWLVPDGSMDRTPIVLPLCENYTSIYISLNSKRHIIFLVRHVYFFWD